MLVSTVMNEAASAWEFELSMEYILDGACIGVALKRDLCMEECEGRREEELVVLSVSYIKFSSWPSKAAAHWGWERY